MLANGPQLIFSGKNPSNPVSRNILEDRSLNPKAVTVLDANNEAQPWYIERTPGGFRVRANGAPTGGKGGRVFAFVNGEPGDEWTIRPAYQGKYTISGPNGYWTLPDQPPRPGPTGEQILLTPADYINPNDERFQFVIRPLVD